EQVALRHRGDRGCDFLRRPDQVVDQGIDRGFHLAPRAVRDAEFDAVPGFAFATDDFSDALELLRHSFVRSNDLVEGIGDFSKHSLVLDADSYGKVAGTHGAQRLKEFLQFLRRGQFRGTIFRTSTFFCGSAISSFLICDCSLIHRPLPNNPLSSGALECAGHDIGRHGPTLMEEQHLVSLNTMKRSQDFWGKNPRASPRSSVFRMERPPAIKFDNRPKVPGGAIIAAVLATCL